MPRTPTADKPADETPEAATPEAAADETDGTNDGMVFADELPEDTHKVEKDSKYGAAVIAIRANPGKWGKVFSAKDRNGARTRTYQLKKKYDDIEWTFRGNDVWGRLITDTEDATESGDADTEAKK